MIPVNILVCLISLVAALSLFMAPIIKFDVGKILRDKAVIEFIDEKIDSAIDGTLGGTDQEGLDYKPVATNIVNGVLSKAEGSISISAFGAFQVLTAGNNKAQKVLDELLFGKKALATGLINSVVDGVTGMFETKEGKALLEEALVSVLTSQILQNVDDEEVSESVAKNVKEFVEIFHELGDPEKVPDGKVDGVVNKLIDKVESMLGDDTEFADEEREKFINTIQELYDNTKSQLGEGETVSIESIICVTISENIDLSGLNINDLINQAFGDKSGESGVHTKAVDEEIGNTDGETQEGENTEGENTEGEGTEGGEEKNNTIVTNYNDMLAEMGFDKEAQENLKVKLRTTLNDGLTDIITQNGIDSYLGYYGYIFFAILPFIAMWLIQFLFAFFHLLAKNKRFTMWYVKLICWIPSLFWLVLAIFPLVAKKVGMLSELWNGEHGGLIQAVYGGLSSFTWINGLCYLLLWIISIVWAFPIKRKIKKERRNPDYEDYDNYDEYDENEEYDEYGNYGSY